MVTVREEGTVLGADGGRGCPAQWMHRWHRTAPGDGECHTVNITVMIKNEKGGRSVAGRGGLVPRLHARRHQGSL